MHVHAQTLEEIQANLDELAREARTLEREVRAGTATGPRATLVQSGLELSANALARIRGELLLALGMNEPKELL